MKFNFYISCENSEEAQQCVAFIDQMTKARELPKYTPHASVPIAADDEDEPKAVRPNVSPGEPAIGKIGSSTKDMLLAIVKQNKSASAANFGVKYVEHMKLLWSRGEVCFDGKDYYL